MQEFVMSEVDTEQAAAVQRRVLGETQSLTAYLDIPIYGIHQCNGTRLEFVQDSNTNGRTAGRFVESKCDRNGLEEAADIHIASYKADMWATRDNTDASTDYDHLLTGADAIVIRDAEIQLKVDYPLNHAHYFPLKSSAGFTRRAIVEAVVQTYVRIYSEEKDTIRHMAVIPASQRRGLINRNTTDGKYGIWGHDIGDLVIEGIEYDPASKTVALSIGS